MLTNQQLEPYYMYEWTPKETGIEKHAIELKDMAENTHKLYFSEIGK